VSNEVSGISDSGNEKHSELSCAQLLFFCINPIKHNGYMFNRSTTRVKLSAAAIWVGGGFVLLWKAWELLWQAMTIRSGDVLPWAAFMLGIVVGIFKARLLFAHVCKKNLQRIEFLSKPKMWHCYRPRFFVFLVLMIVAGILLSAWSQDRYAMLICVAILDLSVGVALLASSYVFWKH